MGAGTGGWKLRHLGTWGRFFGEMGNLYIERRWLSGQRVSDGGRKEHLMGEEEKSRNFFSARGDFLIRTTAGRSTRSGLYAADFFFRSVHRFFIAKPIRRRASALM